LHVASRAFGRVVGRTIATLRSSSRLRRLLAAAAALIRNPATALARLRPEVETLIRLIRAVLSGTYHLPLGTLFTVLLGLAYFVDPIDLIPDAIPVIGFVDDAAVLTWVLRRVRKDLDAFRAWEDAHSDVIDVYPSAPLAVR
jgi:uncharacterized membrane protein YkvA (DUF1232 family)